MKHRERGARMRGGRPGIISFTAGAAVISAAILSGCAGPTYGTGKPSEQQLLEDLTGVLSLGPRERAQIDYKPRPPLVKPPSTEVLPPPQESVAAAGNPAWPESPEQRLARIRAEATANQDNPNYRPNIIRDMPPQSREPTEFVMEPSRQRLAEPSTTSRAQREAILRRRQEATQGSPTVRRYLSDPPLELRQPAATAPAGELGEDERAKERAAKQAASQRSGGLRDLIPWL